MRLKHVYEQNVRLLNINEKTVVEKDAIAGLQTALGVESSREIVERAAFELSDRLARLELALLNGDLAQTSQIAGTLVGISEQIGLEIFARVAKDLVDAIHNNDFVAVAAIGSRLLRQGEQALYEVVVCAENPA